MKGEKSMTEFKKWCAKQKTSAMLKHFVTCMIGGFGIGWLCRRSFNDGVEYGYVACGEQIVNAIEEEKQKENIESE